MTKEQFEVKKAAIEAIPDKQAVYPNMPVDTALQEAEDLHVWCLTDKEALLKGGLDWTLVDDLPNRTGACRYIQSEWMKEFNSLKEAQKEWKLKSPAAFELRDLLVHEFFHAYFKYPDLYARTQKISEGDSNADMIQDLSDLAALGKANPEPLQKISFNESLLDTAEATSTQMATLLAYANGDKQSSNTMRLLRDKAYAHLKEAVDEIRRCGQYAFWKNEQRLKGYASMYYKRQAAKAAKAQAEKEKTTQKA